ncbi:fructuronate reductase [Litoreibacter meonggei]|uniref:Fructuronate reductase n=1 Tax=Litoreibacter meonggei TaxID=1049199 RepID=A0A497VLB1_9RHOB|nr:mannitol dehydrogenase family protein [Litoreibacter meonggei]RLJ41005.1 fructuronate reductase [Litoreibacter meonggei]
MTMERLTASSTLPADVRQPAYVPSEHGCGIVHLGLGAFHKAHQAVYTDDALAAAGGDWRTIGASLRSPKAAEELNPQNGLFTLIERGVDNTSARVIGSIAKVIAAKGNSEQLLETLSDPRIRIASLTVTEKAYGIERMSGGIDTSHPAVAADILSPDSPVGVLGILVAALKRRCDAETKPFTVLCCDNLPNNGAFVRAGVLEFARRIDPALADWIEAQVSFPSTMVDRITPAATQATLSEARDLTGCSDLAAVETEPFSQWVIEDDFPTGRPAWDAGGALFVKNVAQYENMKLRMLNGTHSMLAYAGFLSGRDYVCDVMADPDLAKLVKRHIIAASHTLDPVPGVDLNTYAESLLQRFSNPNIRHETYQIAMDGTEKLPQRIFEPAITAMERGQSIAPFAFATAVWMRYCLGRTDNNATFELRDPRQDQIEKSVGTIKSPDEIATRLSGLDGFMPKELILDQSWNSAVSSKLALMLDKGMLAALHNEAK